jgi:hypothetical protein
VTGEQEILRSARSVLLVDWPSRDVPDALADAGYAVFVKNGPGPTDFNPAPPEQVDLVYCHRPLEELPGIVALAQELGARAVWCQSPSAKARRIAEAAGLRYFGEEYIADAVRRLSP